ncbi:hypothetical protein LXL04_028037 [Taraxacum kok-saghyz]
MPFDSCNQRRAMNNLRFLEVGVKSREMKMEIKLEREGGLGAKIGFNRWNRKRPCLTLLRLLHRQPSRRDSRICRSTPPRVREIICGERVTRGESESTGTDSTGAKEEKEPDTTRLKQRHLVTDGECRWRPLLLQCSVPRRSPAVKR